MGREEKLKQLIDFVNLAHEMEQRNLLQQHSLETSNSGSRVELFS